ncbi:MAG TPA: hypothetical protein VEB66_04660 [Opitutaceae bacterium]|nr:hypothetical protein [Opitutaceae bacterium]
MKPILRAASGGLLLALLAGCNTTKTTGGQAKPVEEYVYVSETGSNIPRKVRKGSTADGSTNLEKSDGRTLEQMQRDQTIRNMRRDGS